MGPIHAAGNGNQREVWKNIKTLSGKTRARTSVVRDKTGKLKTDTDQKLKRWKEYFEELLNPTLNTSTIPTLGYGDKENFFPDLPLYPPTAEELIKALPRFKNTKLQDMMRSPMKKSNMVIKPRYLCCFPSSARYGT